MTARPNKSGAVGAVECGPGIGPGDRDPRSLTVPAAPVSPALRVFIPWMAPSLNTIWSGRKHWGQRARIAKEGHKATMVALMGAPKLRPPVILVFQPVHPRGRRFDALNYALSAKVIEDGLVRARLLGNDSGAYVQAVVLLRAKRGRGGESGVWLEVLEVGE